MKLSDQIIKAALDFILEGKFVNSFYKRNFTTYGQYVSFKFSNLLVSMIEFNIKEVINETDRYPYKFICPFIEINSTARMNKTNLYEAYHQYSESEWKDVRKFGFACAAVMI